MEKIKFLESKQVKIIQKMSSNDNLEERIQNILDYLKFKCFNIQNLFLEFSNLKNHVNYSLEKHKNIPFKINKIIDDKINLLHNKIELLKGNLI